MQNAAILLPVLCLLWFIVGIVVGRCLKAGSSGAPARPARRGRKREAPRREGGGGSEIYVGNLPYEVRDEELRKMFGKFGKVASARIIENRANGKSKGYGFVEMADRARARAAIGGMNGKSVKGRKLVVNEAKSGGRKD